jgi:hypothetical protein
MSNMSLAQATGTRVDSATKHICVGRSDTAYITKHVQRLYPGQNATSMLKMHKLDYDINKNDLLIQSAYLSKDDPKGNPGAYCAVINQFLGADFENQEYLQAAKFAGVSLGHAEADGKVGDNTMAVMMGGTITLRNGPVAINAGDQIYWGVRGARKPDKNYDKKHGKKYDPCDKNHDTKYHPGITATAGSLVVYPFNESVWTKEGVVGKEIIGKALSSARPFEMIDILICRLNSQADYLRGYFRLLDMDAENGENEEDGQGRPVSASGSDESLRAPNIYSKTPGARYV